MAQLLTAAPPESTPSSGRSSRHPVGAPRDELEQQIQALQEKIKTAPPSGPLLERLGWLYIARARRGNIPGYYKLAEACADRMAALNAKDPGVLLLRGHIWQSLHQFKRAEPVAQELVRIRGASFDFGLLGDVLLDLGRVAEAVEAYQKMVDLRPDLQSYARAAQVRWLTGDVDGAVELMEMAVHSASPRDPDASAWAYTRLAHFQWLSEQTAAARRSVSSALAVQPEYAPALLLRGRIELGLGQTNEAVATLRAAARLNPLPEYQWLLADALRLCGQDGEQKIVEARMLRDGRGDDPRTVALFLATRAAQPAEALRLARQELETRGDVFTHDALAWALWRNGEAREACAEIKKALAQDTADARIFLHAAAILPAAESAAYLAKASALERMLFPSERNELKKLQPKGAVPASERLAAVISGNKK